MALFGALLAPNQVWPHLAILEFLPYPFSFALPCFVTFYFKILCKWNRVEPDVPNSIKESHPWVMRPKGNGLRLFAYVSALTHRFSPLSCLPGTTTLEVALAATSTGRLWLWWKKHYRLQGGKQEFRAGRIRHGPAEGKEAPLWAIPQREIPFPCQPHFPLTFPSTKVSGFFEITILIISLAGH